MSGNAEQPVKFVGCPDRFINRNGITPLRTGEKIVRALTTAH